MTRSYPPQLTTTSTALSQRGREAKVEISTGNITAALLAIVLSGIATFLGVKMKPVYATSSRSSKIAISVPDTPRSANKTRAIKSLSSPAY